MILSLTIDEFNKIVTDELAGRRLDLALVELFPEYSRARLQQWVKCQAILVNGQPWRCRDKVSGGEAIRLSVPENNEVEAFVPEPVPLDVVYQDDSLLVLNKPQGRVVHPAAGNWGGTLLNGLLYQFPELSAVPRAGIVHRLDKDTTGLMVVARSLAAHKSLIEAMQNREIKRRYIALVHGQLISGRTIDEPMGRHPADRKRMAVVFNGKPAVTHFLIRQRFAAHMLLDVQLETGRTHQIRVHMAHIKHPIVGDPVYGGRLRIPKDASDALVQALRGFRRQALHAARLGLRHPLTGEEMEWEVPIPDDFSGLLATLQT